jgi:hypothetical protein
MNKHLLEKMQIVSGIIPVDLETAANNGDWVDMKNYARCAIVVFKAAGTAGDDPVITVQQASDVVGTGAKALNFTRVDSKQGAQTGIGQFTKTIQAAANTFSNDTLAESQALIVIDIDQNDLDINGGFSCVQVSIPDAGAAGAQIGCALYILHDPRFGTVPLLDAIT